MSTPMLFIDRDGTLIEEPQDHQVDALEKVRFLPGVFAALSELSRRGYRLVMVTNQDGLGTTDFPEASFRVCQEFVLETLASQGVQFDAIFVCPHRESEGCACRKPKAGLLTAYLQEYPLDPRSSAVIGDRTTDLDLARNLGLRGFTVSRDGGAEQTWAAVTQALTARHAAVLRKTNETRIDVRVNLDREASPKILTGIGFFDHMLEQLAKHGGFALELTANGDLKVDEHHTVEDSALALGEALRQALGDKFGIARFGFVLPMDDAKAAVALDLSGRPFFKFEGHFARDKVGDLPTELVPHFFRSLSETLRATLHVSVIGENTHHMVEACFKSVGRSLRQAFRSEGRELPTTKGVL
jgi:imidazoleglycerol-phosphate dehydratase / histidinol-phosphatase